MARRSWSVQDPKNRFSKVVEAARREPQTVTKHGKPAVVIVAAEEYKRLRGRVEAHHAYEKVAKSVLNRERVRFEVVGGTLTGGGRF